MHIDGAYGALASMAIPEAFDGIALADSISLDPHKWLYQPTGCGCLLYRDPADARRAFSHSAEYARTLSSDAIEGFAFFEESIELRVHSVPSVSGFRCATTVFAHSSSPFATTCTSRRFWQIPLTLNRTWKGSLPLLSAQCVFATLGKPATSTH